MNDLVTVENKVAIFDTARFEHMQRVATAMSQARLVPKHLQESVADCLMVCQQADRWQMDPFAVAQCTFVISGKLGYEGKLVAAVINSRAGLARRLDFNIEGEGDDMKVTVSGTFEFEDEPRTITATVGEAKTSNEKWRTMPDQMLCYYGARKWSRRHAPEVMLGVMTEDELDAIPMKDITPSKPVDLEEEGVKGAGETEGNAEPGVTEVEEKATPPKKATRKRIPVMFRKETLYKTKFLKTAKAMLDAVEDEDEFEELTKDLKAACDGVKDHVEGLGMWDEIEPLVQAIRKDFEEGEDLPEDDEPATESQPLADVPDDLDLASE